MIAIGKPIRDIVGYWITGMTPNRLFTRISMNIANSSGTNRKNSLLPKMSRAMLLRTRSYSPSVAI